MWTKNLSLVFLLHLMFVGLIKCLSSEERNASELLETINQKNLINMNKLTLANWNYDSNITDYNLKIQLNVTKEVAKDSKNFAMQVSQYNWTAFSNESLKRQFRSYSIFGDSILPETDLTRLGNLVAEMTKRYSTSKICDFNNPTKCDLLLEPDIEKILATSRNPKELSHVWVKFRDAVGPYSKNKYKEYVDLKNKQARLNNFTDYTRFLMYDYEDSEFQKHIEDLWNELEPFYKQIHGYVRHKLNQRYGDSVVSKDGPIPAHLLGNMWAQSWSNIADLTLPFPNITQQNNVTAEMLKKGFTVKKIFTTAEDFFKSINMTNMTSTFWNKSILEKPSDREIVCHASAWDMYSTGDFRIKQCTEITEEYFYVAHHEMGHIQYYMQYENQSVAFRNGANDGFHEAIGDTISLSVKSTKHLKKVELMPANTTITNETEINLLYQEALDTFALYPFAYIIDLYRWGIYSGNTTIDNYNCKWWELREKYQGVEPPVDRSEDDFDPAAKYHIIADVPYIRYFIMNILKFQFHEALCKKANEYEKGNPEKKLHNCDIYDNKEAGNALKAMLSLGSSKPWPEALESLIGIKQMNVSSVLEYYAPLKTWLEDYNRKNNITINWKKSTKVCTKSSGISYIAGGRSTLTITTSILITLCTYILL